LCWLLVLHEMKEGPALRSITSPAWLIYLSNKTKRWVYCVMKCVNCVNHHGWQAYLGSCYRGDCSLCPHPSKDEEISCMRLR
jgi:hypothetical protein